MLNFRFLADDDLIKKIKRVLSSDSGEKAVTMQPAPLSPSSFWTNHSSLARGEKLKGEGGFAPALILG